MFLSEPAPLASVGGRGKLENFELPERNVYSTRASTGVTEPEITEVHIQMPSIPSPKNQYVPIKVFPVETDFTLWNNHNHVTKTTIMPLRAPTRLRKLLNVPRTRSKYPIDETDGENIFDSTSSSTCSGEFRESNKFAQLGNYEIMVNYNRQNRPFTKGAFLSGALPDFGDLPKTPQTTKLRPFKLGGIRNCGISNQPLTSSSSRKSSKSTKKNTMSDLNNHVINNINEHIHQENFTEESHGNLDLYYKKKIELRRLQIRKLKWQAARRRAEALSQSGSMKSLRDAEANERARIAHENKRLIALKKMKKKQLERRRKTSCPERARVARDHLASIQSNAIAEALGNMKTTSIPDPESTEGVENKKSDDNKKEKLRSRKKKNNVNVSKLKSIEMISTLFKHWRHWKLKGSFVWLQEQGQRSDFNKKTKLRNEKELSIKQDISGYFKGSLLRSNIRPDLKALRKQIALEGRQSRLGTGYGAQSRNAVADDPMFVQMRIPYRDTWQRVIGHVGNDNALSKVSFKRGEEEVNETNKASAKQTEVKNTSNQYISLEIEKKQKEQCRNLQHQKVEELNRKAEALLKLGLDNKNEKLKRGKSLQRNTTMEATLTDVGIPNIPQHLLQTRMNPNDRVKTKSGSHVYHSTTSDGVGGFWTMWKHRLGEKDPSLVKLCIPPSERLKNNGLQLLAETMMQYRNKSLTDLQIPLNEVGDAGIIALSQILPLYKTLLPGETILSKRYYSCRITSLDLRCNLIGPAGAKALGDALSCQSCVTSINLSDNRLGHDGVNYVLAQLRNNTGLKTLSMQCNNIGKGPIREGSIGIRMNRSLTHLDLSVNSIDSEGALSLTGAIRDNKGLLHLDLRRNDIGDAGLVFMGSSLKLNSTIQTLLMANNGIGDEGTQYLAGALKSNCSLTILDMGTNQITDIGGTQLAEALVRNTNLVSLNLFNNSGISNDSVIWFRSILAHRNVSLTNLNIPSTKLTDPSIMIEIKELLQLNSRGVRDKEKVDEEFQRTGGGLFPVSQYYSNIRARWLPPVSRPVSRARINQYKEVDEYTSINADERILSTSRMQLLDRMTELEIVIANAEKELHDERVHLGAEDHSVLLKLEESKKLKQQLAENDEVKMLDFQRRPAQIVNNTDIIGLTFPDKIPHGESNKQNIEYDEGTNRIEALEIAQKLHRKQLEATKMRMISQKRTMENDAVEGSTPRNRYSPVVFNSTETRATSSNDPFFTTPRGWTREGTRDGRYQAHTIRGHKLGRDTLASFDANGFPQKKKSKPQKQGSNKRMKTRKVSTKVKQKKRSLLV